MEHNNRVGTPIGRLYAVKGRYSASAEDGSRLYWKDSQSGMWIPSSGPSLSKKDVKKASALMELTGARNVCRVDGRECGVWMDVSLNVISLHEVEGFIRQFGEQTTAKGVTEFCLYSEDLLKPLEGLLQATVDQCVGAVQKPWGPESSVAVFKMLRTNPSLNLRGILIDNVVIADSFGCHIFNWGVM